VEEGYTLQFLILLDVDEDLYADHIGGPKTA